MMITLQQRAAGQASEGACQMKRIVGLSTGETKLMAVAVLIIIRLR